MIQRLDLAGTWQWHVQGETAVYRGSVPGSVLGDMLANKLIDDPFWRTNEYETREKMAADYFYTRRFTVEPDCLEADEAELVCEGLDTLAEIRINGEFVARTQDMHSTYRFPVKQYLKPGENEISVLFRSSLRFVRHEDETNDIHYASTGCIHGNAALRKAHYMFGWDWGPQLPDAGIFRPIGIEFIREARLLDVYIRQTHTRPGGPVDISVDVDAECFRQPSARVEVTVMDPDGKELRSEIQWPAQRRTVLTVQDPQLWWPNGMGAHPLYTVKAVLCTGETKQDEVSRRIGLRTITVSTEADEWGNEFAFVVNGKKVFAMGANYVPQDNLIPRVTPERYRELVRDSAAANMNMIRVWGGGYYPDDAFYDACDEFGIMIWQDMMFACNVYALTDSFERDIVQETRDNVRRLRHHACLALWCSNNEMEWGWGDEWARIRGHHPRYKADYLKIFEMVLPRTLRKYDDQTFFWPSSPSSGGAYDDPNGFDRGDQHYWDVWHSGKPFTEYRNHHFRFCSEYGFQSFPEMKTIRSFALPEDFNIFSEVMESHQKNNQANTKIFTYVSDYFLYPKDLDAIAYVSQILQLKAIQYGVEHWRQNRGRCMGSLYWQLNDCWPVASWASIDYYGRWKALHYGAKRFYAPVCASAREKEELSPEITYYVHNETLEPRTLRLEAVLLDTQFRERYSVSTQVCAPALSSVAALSVDYSTYIRSQEDKKDLVARYRLYDENGVCISEGCTQFVKPKHFRYPDTSYEVQVADAGDWYDVTVRSDAFSNYTELSLAETDGVFSDNFFDITEPSGRTVRLYKDRLSQDPGAAALQAQMKVRSVAQTYLREE